MRQRRKRGGAGGGVSVALAWRAFSRPERVEQVPSAHRAVVLVAGEHGRPAVEEVGGAAQPALRLACCQHSPASPLEHLCRLATPRLLLSLLPRELSTLHCLY